MLMWPFVSISFDVALFRPVWGNLIFVKFPRFFDLKAFLVFLLSHPDGCRNNCTDGKLRVLSGKKAFEVV